MPCLHVLLRYNMNSKNTLPLSANGKRLCLSRFVILKEGIQSNNELKHPYWKQYHKEIWDCLSYRCHKMGCGVFSTMAPKELKDLACVHIACLSLTQNSQFYTPPCGFVLYILFETETVFVRGHSFIDRNISWQSVLPFNISTYYC